MKVIYVAGPYRAPTLHQVVANIRAAEAVGLACWQAGAAAIVPHKNTALFDGAVSSNPSEDAETWLAGDIEILRRCDALVTVPGWERSQGATAEVAEARRMIMSVFHWPECEEELRHWAAQPHGFSLARLRGEA